MICRLTNNDLHAMLKVVNSAAEAYRGKIPSDRWKEPYMPLQELKEEIESDMQFYGVKEDNALIAVMGIQLVDDVTLIRHAYVLPSFQRKGVGGRLLKHLLLFARTPKVYVGTWVAATWAIKFYQKNRFELVPTEEKDQLLKKYWNISQRQIETSVVLELKRKLK